MWASFSGAGGRGNLHILPPRQMMNKDRYKIVLEQEVLPTMAAHNSTYFLHDKAPCHTAKINKKFLKVNMSFVIRADLIFLMELRQGCHEYSNYSNYFQRANNIQIFE